MALGLDDGDQSAPLVSRLSGPEGAGRRYAQKDTLAVEQAIQRLEQLRSVVRLNSPSFALAAILGVFVVQDFACSPDLFLHQRELCKNCTLNRSCLWLWLWLWFDGLFKQQAKRAQRSTGFTGLDAG
jgi:hypothetical protein